MTKAGYSVAVVGATGLVGSQVVAVLEERQFPLRAIQLYASPRSAGDEVRCGALPARVELLDSARFADTDVVFLAAGEQVSVEWLERITDSGAVAIDTSQVFADDLGVPLIVPEVNAGDVAGFVERRLVVSPDPVAIGLSVVLHPLHAVSPLVRVVTSTFEPVSGAGRAGIEELQRQIVDLMSGRGTEPERFPHRIAFNLLPHVGEFLAGGASKDEEQTVRALRRLLDVADLPVSVTRVRAPLFYGMALSVNVQTADGLTADQAREIWRDAPGVLLQDDVAAQLYPTAADAVGQDAALVGRVRDETIANGLDLWVALDNIRKGAALNAVQIAERLISEHL